LNGTADGLADTFLSCSSGRGDCDLATRNHQGHHANGSDHIQDGLIDSISDLRVELGVKRLVAGSQNLVKNTVRPIVNVARLSLIIVSMTALLVTTEVLNSAVGAATTKVTPVSFSFVGTTEIQSISCVGKQYCVALGSSKSSGSLVITKRNGTWGKPVDFSTSFPTSDGVLNSVSCIRVEECVASGFGFNKENVAYPMLLWQYQGHWGVPDVPNLTMGGRLTQPVLYSASCASVGSCTTVGYGVLRGTHHAMGIAIRETNGVWSGSSAVPTNERKASPFTALRLSCPTSGECVAAGDGVKKKLCCTEIVTRSHGVWASPSFAADTLEGVSNLHAYVRDLSCFGTAGNCLLLEVYYTSNGTPEYFSVREHDGIWGQGDPIHPGLSKRGYNLLYGLSCVSSRACTAVGYKAVATGRFEALVEQYIDGQWLPAQLVNPDGATDTSSALVTVTCTEARCTAGGSGTFHGQKTGVVITFRLQS
jgi:hypothetical protein